MPFKFQKLDISEVILVQPTSFQDERGFFLECFKDSAFKNNEMTKFVQDNFSHSSKNVLRGLHFQNNPKAQGKLVMALQGEIFDVAVDMRKNSPTYGKWIGEILSDKNHNMLFIPEGFAHGFCVLSDYADVYYKVTQEYSSEHDHGIIWNDPDIDITWPINKPVLSKKDLKLPQLKNSRNNFIYK